MMDARNLRTVQQLADECEVFTVSSLKMLIHRGEVNGFAKCVVRVQRRVYIDTEALGEWLEQRRMAR